MKIINKTRNTVVAGSFRTFKGILGKTIGLMFSLKPKTIVFEYAAERKVPLHMVFVFFPIDVMYVDAKKKVVEAASLKPFTFYNPKRKSKFVIELPYNSTKKSMTKIGDIIAFES